MAPETTQVENPFGLIAFWHQLDTVGTGVLILLVIMSLASWYVILTKLWDQRRLRKDYVEVHKGFWTAGNLRDGINKLGKENAFRMVAEDGVRAAQHHEGRLTDQIPLRRTAAPREIGAVVRFLASADADYITGQVICVDGGMAV